jgi:hypothetical protein
LFGAIARANVSRAVARIRELSTPFWQGFGVIMAYCWKI